MRSILFALLVLTALPSAAQEGPSQRGVFGVLEGRQASISGYYFNAQPGEAVTRVHVWGQVLRPGVYDVGPDFDLEGVLTLAGVASKQIQEEGDQDLILRLYRAGDAVPVYEATVPQFVRDAAPPDIAYGDIIELQREGVARVAVWGDVADPGIFEVGPSFSARDVLALAGGPRLLPLSPSQTRTTTVTVYRGAGGAAAYDGTLDAFLSGGAPALENGDVIQVESALAQGWTTRDTLTVVGILTSGAFAIAQIINVVTN